MKATQVTESDLTSDELRFLRDQNICIEQVLHTKGMIKIGHKRALEAKGAKLGINGSTCVSGHRLRTRSDHCPQCRPANLAFEARHSTKAFVYVCQSETDLIKIGFSTDVNDRIRRHNRECHASCSNWKLLFSFETEKAGKVEAETHTALARYNFSQAYEKGDGIVNSREVFSCSAEVAILAVRKALSNRH